MTPPRLLVAVAVGGAVGAVLRWVVGEAVGPAGPFPWTTFAVNLSGSAGLALVGALAAVRADPALAAGLGPGLFGGFTTLSAAAEETRALLAEGDALLGAGYLVGSLVACATGVLLVRAALPGAVGRP